MKSARRPRRAPAGSRRALEPADHLHRFVRLVRSGRWEELRLFLDASTVWMIDHHEPGEVFVESSARWFAERTGFELYVLEPVTVRALEGTAMARAAARATWRGADGCLEEASIGLALELASSRRGAWKPVALSLSSGIKVHAGCGPDDFFPRLLNGWVNLDLLHDEPGHGRVDLLSEWPFAEGSAAAVYSEDFIEHLDQREQLIFLGEAFRVLQPGGVLRTVCPALSEDIVRRRFFPAWPRTGFRTIDEGVEWREWGHRLLPTYEYLARVLELVGFVGLLRHQKHASDIPAFPGDKRPLSDRQEGDELYVEVAKPARDPGPGQPALKASPSA